VVAPYVSRVIYFEIKISKRDAAVTVRGKKTNVEIVQPHLSYYGTRVMWGLVGLLYSRMKKEVQAVYQTAESDCIASCWQRLYNIWNAVVLLTRKPRVHVLYSIGTDCTWKANAGGGEEKMFVRCSVLTSMLSRTYSPEKRGYKFIIVYQSCRMLTH
jgi:hypothetical protein